MSTKPTATVTTAPWKPLFASQLAKTMPDGTGVEFALATVTSTGQPRVRTCIHRSFFTNQPDNPHNKLAKNPEIYETDCPAFTTDARMNKVFDIFSTGAGKGSLSKSLSGTGGGGPVEAVYWLKDCNTQWRIRGQCWLLAAADIEGGEEAAQNSGTVSMKAALQRYMRRVNSDSDHSSSSAPAKDWSWRLEVENHFENLSPIMRGTFKNPKPGKPVSAGIENPGEALGQKGGHLKDEELALANFRVAVITPEQVEQVDFSDPTQSKRWIWSLTDDAEGSEDGNQWTVTRTWP